MKKADFEASAGLATGLVLPLEVKALDAKDRTFEGLLSTWDVDQGFDRVVPGAFARTLDHWRASKDKVIPLIDQHGYRFMPSIRQVLGKLTDADERSEGLWTKWWVLEGEDGDQALRRIQSGVVNKMSMGFRPVRWDFEDIDTDEGRITVRNLREVELGEGSLVIFPMNPGAAIDTDSVKALADAILAGEVKMASDALADLKTALDKALAGLEPGTKDPKREDQKPDKALAPDDPRRQRMQSELRALTLRTLGVSPATRD